MARFFNTAGPCRPELHYMLPPERRLPEPRGLIDRQLYFVVHAPRQTGKTTFFRSLAQFLTAEGRYAALLTSCEVGQAAQGDVESGIEAVLGALRIAAENHLPEELRPPAIPRALTSVLEQTLPLPRSSPVVCLEIPQDVLDSARLSLDQVRVELAIHLYEQGRLSIGKAHELAGLSLWEFRELLGARQIPAHFSAEDLEQDVEMLRERDSRY
jgi:predicted HTH domain antitoxin